jgi:flagellar motor switch protein FliM
MNASEPAAPSFDFRGEVPLHGSHLQALRVVHLDLCARMAAALAGEGFQADFAGISLMSSRAAVEGIGPAAYITALAESSPARIAFTLPRGHAFALLEGRLGASGGPAAPDRDLRTVEQRLLAGWAAELLLPLYEEAWPPLRALRLTLGPAAGAVEALPVLRPEEQFVRIQMSMGHPAGPGLWNIFIPAVLARAMLVAPKTPEASPAAGPVSPTDSAVTARLLGATVRLSVLLGEQRLPLKDLMPLRPGRILQLDRGPGSELIVLVNGRRLFTAKAGQQNNRLAVSIERRTSEEERDAA